MIIIEVKNGTVIKCLSNNKNLQVTILDYDTQTETPDVEEMEAENLGIKDLRAYLEEATQPKDEEPEPFGDIFNSMNDITNNFKENFKL